MATFARVLMRALMMLTTLLIATAAFLAAQTPFQHVTVALFIFLFCAVRYVGLSVIERSELVMINAQQSAASRPAIRCSGIAAESSDSWDA